MAPGSTRAQGSTMAQGSIMAGGLHAVANGDEMVSLDVGLSFLLCLVIALRVRLVTPLVNPHQGRLKELGVQPFREGLKRVHDYFGNTNSLPILQPLVCES